MKLKNIFACFDTRTEVIQQTWYSIQLLQSVSSVHMQLKSGAFFMVIDLLELNLCIVIENGGTEYKKLHNRWIINIKNLRMTLPKGGGRLSLDPPLNRY